MEGVITVKFYVDESAIQEGHYLVRLDFSTVPSNVYTKGSFAVLGARVLGISWPNYLRLCRDEFSAEIIGKGSSYPVAYFTKEGAIKLVALLNERCRK